MTNSKCVTLLKDMQLLQFLGVVRNHVLAFSGSIKHKYYANQDYVLHILGEQMNFTHSHCNSVDTKCKFKFCNRSSNCAGGDDGQEEEGYGGIENREVLTFLFFCSMYVVEHKTCYRAEL
jgi:hypothetical protein